MQLTSRAPALFRSILLVAFVTHILVVFLQRYHALALFYCYHNQTAQAMEVWKKYALTLYQNILEEKKGFYNFPLDVFERITLQGL